MPQKTPTNFWLSIRKNIANQRQKSSIKPAYQHSKLNIPLSYNQEQLWQLDRLNIDSVHNIANALRFTIKLDFTVLEKSLQEIVRRHTILRTTFPVVNGKPKQNITSETIFKLPILDLRELSPTEKLERAKQIAVTEKQRPFKLTQEAAFRVKLLYLTDDESVLLLTMHHLIFDGSSFTILFQELKTLYKAFEQNKPSPLRELPIQYADFALWQRQWLEDTPENSALNYWKENLAGEIQPLQLPIDNPRTSVFNYQGKSQYLKLSSSLTAKLKAFSINQGTTLFTTLLTAFNILLNCYTKQTDLLLVSPIEGRDRPETKQLIGYFSNLLILRSNLEHNPTFLQLLERINQTVLKAKEHQDIPFKKLTELPSLAAIPLSRAMFALSNYKIKSLELSGISPTSLDVRSIEQEKSNFDLSLSMCDRGEQITGIIRYKTKLFKPETINLLKSNFISLLEIIVTNPNVSLSNLPSFNQSENINTTSLLPKQISEQNIIAPRTELEHKIKNIWQEVLGIKTISIRDNFFNLGGHSLTSIKLMLELEKTFQQQLPWSVCAQLTTIEEQVALIIKAGFTLATKQVKLNIANPPAKSSSLTDENYRQLLALTSGWQAPRMTPDGLIMGLNTNGSKPPFFWSAGAFREIAPLAEHLTPEQPIYGLFNGYGVLQFTQKNIKILASHYVSEILALHFDEPYFLGGYCLGGLLTFEIAQQLQKQGKKVALLILVDSYLPRNYDNSISLIFGSESYKNPYRSQPRININWLQQFSKGLEVHLVPGNHRLLDDNLISETAARLKSCLEKAQNTDESCPTIPSPTSQLSEVNLVWKAQIKTISNTVAPAGTTLVIPISVKNLSSLSWSTTSTIVSISLVSRWLNQQGKFIPWCDSRIALPQPIQPNSEVEISFPVTTPLKPGFYILELGLTQFGLNWFENEDSTTTTVIVEVTKNKFSAYQAEIITQQQLEIAVGETAILPVSVQNISPYPWLCNDESPIRLIGNWFDDKGTVVSWIDSDRGVKLPKYIQAQEIAQLDLPVTAPLKSGSYLLQLDLGQFGSLWLKSQNLPMATVKVEVIGDEASSCQAQITAPKSLQVAVGEIAKIPVKVKNLSSLTWLWERKSHIYLGNHWLDQNRKVIIWDDGLLELPQNLPPQGEIELFLNVTVPLKPASYFLEIDLFQKGITWFKQQGSQTAIVEVEVSEVKGSAFKAQITTQKHLQVAVEKTVTIPVKVKNTSAVPWQSSAKSLINLRNHWLDKNKNILKWDDKKQALPKSLFPQEEVELKLNLTMPKQAGLYFLELDIVQEGITWFKKQGSPTTIVKVEVI